MDSPTTPRPPQQPFPYPTATSTPSKSLPSYKPALPSRSHPRPLEPLISYSTLTNPSDITILLVPDYFSHISPLTDRVFLLGKSLLQWFSNPHSQLPVPSDLSLYTETKTLSQQNPENKVYATQYVMMNLIMGISKMVEKIIRGEPLGDGKKVAEANMWLQLVERWRRMVVEVAEDLLEAVEREVAIAGEMR